jgi:hypothetical protein
MTGNLIEEREFVKMLFLGNGVALYCRTGSEKDEVDESMEDW